MFLMGRPVADKIKEKITEAVKSCMHEGKNLPKISIIRLGDRKDDISYEERVIKNCRSLGIEVEKVGMPIGSSTEELISMVNRLNKREEIHGILIFRPLPPGIDEEEVGRSILPVKDIDCMNPTNMEKVFVGDAGGVAPCTPEAVIELLKYYEYDLSGKKVAIINRSLVLGKPLAMLFLAEDATVTICHSKTKDISSITKDADIVVLGAGKAKHFDASYFSEKSVVVDVGINVEGNQLWGDADGEALAEIVSAITPVPGGVGLVTSMILLKHVVNAMNIMSNIETQLGG
jgi:methylenetetrahydrofolate dehydrogenase (NADP+)/methenyltetrahydrofolate cyclohydrolase